jgi:hypothetical protein
VCRNERETGKEIPPVIYFYWNVELKTPELEKMFIAINHFDYPTSTLNYTNLEVKIYVV